MHKIRWDDLQIVMAVAESGSASAAAQALGLNHSTVLRRVAAFEKQQGIRLFERLPTGYQPTNAARDLLAATNKIEQTVSDIQREILGQDDRLAGQVRLTTTDTIVTSVLRHHLAQFRTNHPEIIVNLTMTNIRLNIARLDAEVSIRPSRSPPDELVGRRVSGLAFGVYIPANQRATSIEDITHWIGISNELKNSPVESWLAEHAATNQIVARADSFVALRELVAAGLGAAVIPCCLADHHAGLTRVGGPIPDLETSLWVLTHRDLKSAARVAALSDFLAKALRSERPLLEGRS